MFLTSRFDDALLLASELHREQVRKASGVPYVAHLLSVAAIVLEHGGGEDEAVAALLHDAIEDQGGDATRQRIRAQFGDHVVEIVDGCTDAETLPKPPWEARKQAHLEKIRNAPPSVLLVTAADKLHNARSILTDLRRLGDDLWPRFSGGRVGTLWYYRSIVELLRLRVPDELFEELERTVSEIERLAS